jgi:hypothetical protein
MRRCALLICLLAGCNLALTPIVMPHAHVHGDHADVFVHGGHDHDHTSVGLDLHDHHHANDAHSDLHHSTDRVHGDSTHKLSLDGDAPHVAHAHVVHLDASAVDPPSRSVAKFKAPVATNSIERPPCIAFVSLLESNVEFAAPRFHFLPPLRGPPATIRNVA